MFRFSRDKRFFQKVSFAEFLNVANEVAGLVLDHQPDDSVEVLTCEDLKTYRYSTFEGGARASIAPFMKQRRYTLGELSEQVWDRSFRLDLQIRGSSESEPSLVWFWIDRRSGPRRLMFYYHSISASLKEDLSPYTKPNLRYSVGDGYPRPVFFDQIPE